MDNFLPETSCDPSALQCQMFEEDDEEEDERRKKNEEMNFCRRKWSSRYNYWSPKLRSQGQNETEPAPVKRIGVCKPLARMENWWR